MIVAFIADGILGLRPTLRLSTIGLQLAKAS